MIRVIFHVVLWPVWLILHVPVFICFVIFICLHFNHAVNNTSQIHHQENTTKRQGILLKLTIKTPEEHQCFLTSPCQWGPSVGYGCTRICLNIYLSVIYFIWHMARYLMRRKCIPTNVTWMQNYEVNNVLLNLLLEAWTFVYQKI